MLLQVCGGGLQGFSSQIAFALIQKSRMVLRSYRDCQAILDLAEARRVQLVQGGLDVIIQRDSFVMGRLSLRERQRLEIDEALRIIAAYGDPSQVSELGKLIERNDTLDRSFLATTAGKPVLKKLSSVVHEDVVVVARYDTYWCEGWLALRSHVVDFFNPSKKRILRIATRDIRAVKPLDGGQQPLPGPFQFFTLETSSRIFYVGCAADRLDLWMVMFNKALAPIRNAQLNEDHAESGLDVAVETAVSDLRELFSVTTPARWKRDNRRILNARRFFFHFGSASPPGSTAAIAASFSSAKPFCRALQRPGSLDEQPGRSMQRNSTARENTFEDDMSDEGLAADAGEILGHGKAIGIDRQASLEDHEEDPKPPHHAAAMNIAYGVDPCKVVERLLAMVSRITSTEDIDPLSSPLFSEFMDLATQLRFLDLTSLLTDQRECSEGTESKATAFFLNLYHVMLTHGILVFGPPDSIIQVHAHPSLNSVEVTLLRLSAYQVTKFYNRMCYEVAGDVYSICELEHGVLRAAMSNPDHALLNWAIPQGISYSFKLRTVDPRRHIAINNSNVSCLPYVREMSPSGILCLCVCRVCLRVCACGCVSVPAPH